MVNAAMKLKTRVPWKEYYDKLDRVLKSRDITCLQKSIESKLWFFQWSCMDVRVGPQKRLSTKELMLLNCGAGESLG